MRLKDLDSNRGWRRLVQQPARQGSVIAMVRNDSLLRQAEPRCAGRDRSIDAAQNPVSLPPPCDWQRIGDVAARIVIDILRARPALPGRSETGRGGRHAV
jgi:hypothetical protein